MPVTENSTTVKVRFPKKTNWVDYWNPTKVYSSKEIKDFNAPLDKMPIFFRVGSIIPLNVTKDGSNFGSQLSFGYLTFVINYP